MTDKDIIKRDNRSIYVGNVDYGATTSELEQYFSHCGSINHITIVRDGCTNHPKGFAYIEFRKKRRVGKALEMNESFFRGRQIKVR